MDPSHLVTVHARVRYVERCLGLPIGRLAQQDGVDMHHDGAVWAWAVNAQMFDTAEVEAALVTRGVVTACALKASSVDLGNGFRAMITDGRVTTIISKAITRQRQKALAAPANRYVDKVRSRGWRAQLQKGRAHDYA